MVVLPGALRVVVFSALLILSATVLPTRAATPTSTDLGLTVVTVKVNSITAHFGDWFGPYFQMDYTFQSYNVPTDSSNFRHERDCTNCWDHGYTFRSAKMASLTLTLYDDQSCCFSGFQPVAFNGGSNSITLYFSGAQLMATGGHCVVGLATTCPTTLSWTGTSGGKNASVSITIDSQPALGYQAFLRRSMLQQYYDIGYILQSGQAAQQCFNNYVAGQYQLNVMLVPIILAPFSLVIVEAPTLTQILIEALGDKVSSYIGNWITKTKAEGDAYSLYKVGMFTGGATACANLTNTWRFYSGNNGQAFLSNLAPLITSITNEQNKLRSNNIGLNGNGVISDLNNQKSQIQSTQQSLSGLISYLRSVADGSIPSSCYDNGVVSCSVYARYLVDNFLTPLQTLLNNDAAYITATYNLIYNAANTLTTSNIFGCSEIGLSYTAAISGTGGMPPRTYWVSISSGSLPPGLSFSPGSSAWISGAPTSTGAYTFTVAVTDGASNTKYVQQYLNTVPRIDILATTFPAATQYSYYSSSLTSANGCPPITWSLYSGSLPPGLSLSASGVVSGTPNTSGTYTFTVRVVDGPGGTATRTFSLQVNPGSPPPPPPPPPCYAQHQPQPERCIQTS